MRVQPNPAAIGRGTDDIRAVAIRDAAQPSRIIAAVAAGTSWLVMLLVGAAEARARDTALPYPQMAPLSQYLPTSEGDEIALARSAAPLSLSGEAEIQVLGDRGYRTAVKGRNGFVCMVWRSWSDDFDDEEFWNPKVRAPICLNPSAVRTVLPEYVRRTDWVLSGLSRVEMLGRFKVAVARNEVALPAPGAMSYMMSRDGLLGDGVGHAAPHIMFFVPRAERQQWGANLPNSPIWGAEGASDPVALFFVTVPKWSDGTPVTAH
jgi:hypothetical protein